MSDNAGSSTKNRSPEHPFFDLPTALERAEVLYEHEAFNWTSPAVAVGHWGYSEKSSGGKRTLAALKHFGLVQDEGSSKDRRVRLTDLARRIIRDKREGSVDRVKAIRESALMPSIYEKVWERWGDGDRLPSKATMQYELEHDWGFNPKSVEDFIRDFVSTVEYAGLLDGDMSEAAGGSEPSASPPEASKARPSSDLPSGGSEPTRPEADHAAGTPDPVRGADKGMTLPIPLISGQVAHLSIPVPLTEQDFDLLTATIESTLKVMRPALVRAGQRPSSG